MQLRIVFQLVGASLVILLTACGGTNAPVAEQPATKPAPAATEAAPPAADLAAVARTMVQAAMIKAGDRVFISGSARDLTLLENLVVETMKAGGQPLIALAWSDRLARRSYDEVPASYDNQPPTLGLAMVNAFEVQLAVEAGESESVLAGVPASRIAARTKAGLPVDEAFLKKGVRLVSLGNGLYPTAALAERLGKPKEEVASIFWKAAMVPPDAIRAKGEAIRSVLEAAKQLTLSSANGTNLTFGVAAAEGFVSDGAISAEKAKRGAAAAQTWLPAGELLVPAAPGTAEGKVVVDKLVYQGTTIEALTLVFSKGKLTSMTAKSGLEALKALYDASGGGKDQFGYIDLGLNPEAKLPTGTGRIVWMAPGGITVGLGDNRGWGGTNVSEFNLACPVTNATLSANGQLLIENGTLK